MRLESYLLTEGRSKKIELDEAYDIIKNKCMKAAKAYHKDTARIYRGINNNKEALLVDPKSGSPRESANTSNHYTLLMDNLPSWKKFPKRGRSLICTTFQGRTSGHGIGYAVFPYDGSKIAVASKEDIWFSFKEIGSLRVFNKNFDYVLADVLDKHDDSPDSIGIDKDWKTLKIAMKKFDEYVEKRGNIDRVTEDYMTSTVKWLKNYDGNTVSTLNKDFDPNKNGIKLVTAGKPLPRDEREVWTDGKSVMVKIENTYSTDELMNNLEGMVKG